MKEVDIVGILNLTDDSFSDGGLYNEPSRAIERASELFAQGASLIDVGAESTRPKATPLTAEQEWQRLEKVLPILIARYAGKISLDSYHPETFDRIEPGAVIRNDITCFSNPKMVEGAAAGGEICIVSHIPKSVGQNVQQAHEGNKIDSIEQVLDQLLTRYEEMISAGIRPENIVLDPGIGFGKTPRLNHELIEFASLVPDYAVMVGYSRKRFLGRDPQTNLDAGTRAINSGAKMLRVHDVAGHKRLIDLMAS